jgi:beta-1,2-mannobiose phosphorylase / 1,2-beta-oligomannan phosphorylase
MRPLDLVIGPEPGNANEVGGILNPAATRGPDGELYLFPRLVAKGNYSRIGIARVVFDSKGEPCGIERLGIALEPEMPYELRPDGGGCEDPRVTFVEPLKKYVMTYTAFSPNGPRIALAISKDLMTWERLGLATFEPYEGIHFDGVDNKDAAMFPLAVRNPSDHYELAILHRPLFPGTLPEDTMLMDGDRDVDLHRESIWISYTGAGPNDAPYQLREFTSHHRLAAPVSDWESLKIGSGAPPVMTKHGWLFIYHGVTDLAPPNSDVHHLSYSAGVMILSRDHPQELLYRSTHPALAPSAYVGPRGTPSNVVFPTGIDRRDDIGEPDRLDVYYGINDYQIAVARLDIPDTLPHAGQADPPESQTSKTVI